MCGLAGIWSRSGSDRTEAVRGMLARLRHRGPDAEGLATASPGLVLGHTRLKVLDLSDAANQPFTDGRDVLVFNGEIFNHAALRRDLAEAHAFTTRSDTEVLFRALQRWGVGALERLDGQFAFAFYRHADRSLMLARDHAGICPLYVAPLPDGLAFASEIRPLLALAGARLDPGGVADYLAYRYSIQNGRTLFAGIERFAPAHWRRIALDGGRVEGGRFWKLGFAPGAVPAAEASAAFARTFDRVVAAQASADVPVGLFLSGGVDSGALLEGFARTGTDIRAYTLALSEDDAELAGVRRLRERHSFESRVVGFPDRIDGLLEDTVARLEEPFGDLIICANSVLAESAGGDVRVVLSGEGGDEAFCGYDHQRGFLRLARFRHPLLRPAAAAALSLLPPGLIGRLGGYPGRFGPPERARIARVLARLDDPADAYLDLVRLNDDDALAGLLASGFRSAFGHRPDTAPIRAIFEEESDLRCAMVRCEIEQLTLVVNLLKQDRLCMAFSVEGRVPLASRALLELAAAMPASLSEGPTPKAPLQDYAGLHGVPKRAFSLFATQERVAMVAGLMDRHVTRDAVAAAGVLDWDAMLRLRRDLATGTVLAVKRAMAVLVFCVWWRRFQPAAP